MISSFKRDLGRTSGNQYIVGLPFKPKSVHFRANLNDTPIVSMGDDNGSISQCVYNAHGITANAWRRNPAVSIMVAFDVNTSTSGRITSLYPGGFTVAWIHAGYQGGILEVQFTAERDETYTPAVRPTVLIGDSITEQWSLEDYLPAHNKGRSGDHSYQMAARFSEVLAMNPGKIVILAGTNDCLFQSSPTTSSIAQMANDGLNFGAQVALCTIPPIAPSVQHYPVPTFNGQITSLATSLNVPVVDYYSAMVNPDGSQKQELFFDGTLQDPIHPSTAGYNVMAPILQAVLGGM